MNNLFGGRLQVDNKTVLLVWINVIVFVLQMILGRWFTAFFMLSGSVLNPLMYVRLVTHMFLHGGFLHILFNMYFLYMFGSIIEDTIGSKRFLALYMVAGVVAGFVANFFYTAGMLGASAAVMGIIGITIMLYPNMRLYLFFILPIRLWHAAILFVLIDVANVIHPTNNTGSLAHLIGLGIGLAYGWHYKRKYYY